MPGSRARGAYASGFGFDRQTARTRRRHPGLDPPPRSATLARNKSPQSFAKRKREIEKRRKREEKLERRLDRKYWKKVVKEGGDLPEGMVLEGDGEQNRGPDQDPGAETRPTGEGKPRAGSGDEGPASP